MVIVMRAKATEEHLGTVVERVESLGFGAHISRGTDQTIISVIGNERFGSEERRVGKECRSRWSPYH